MFHHSDANSTHVTKPYCSGMKFASGYLPPQARSLLGDIVIRWVDLLHITTMNKQSIPKAGVLVMMTSPVQN